MPRIVLGLSFLLCSLMLNTAWRDRCYDSNLTAEGNRGSMGERSVQMTPFCKATEQELESRFAELRVPRTGHLALLAFLAPEGPGYQLVP